MPTLYQVLGVPENATPAIIKSAFRKLSMQYHPDRNPGNPAAEALFRDILEAYRILSEPDDRLRYDRRLAWSRVQPKPVAPQPAPQPPPVYQQPHQRSGRFDPDLYGHGQEWERGIPPNMPWRLVGISLLAFILFFVVLYHFGPTTQMDVEKTNLSSLPDGRDLPKGLRAKDVVRFGTGESQDYGDWRASFSHLPFTESWQAFGTKGTPALYVTIYFSPDRHDYRDYVFMWEAGPGLREVFRYMGGAWRNGTQVKLYFGRDVEPGDCSDCEMPGLPNPGIAGIYLRETGQGYTFETAQPSHDAQLRENLEWLMALPQGMEPEAGALAREYLRQVMTWHFLHRADASAEKTFREFYQQTDADRRWREIEEMIATYEKKIASDVWMRTEAI